VVERIPTTHGSAAKAPPSTRRRCGCATCSNCGRISVPSTWAR
jgi:hypothetical protein